MEESKRVSVIKSTRLPMISNELVTEDSEVLLLSRDSCRDTIKRYTPYAALALMGDVIMERQRQEFTAELPEKPLPKGAKRWPQYGNVVAINEKNAKRKFSKRFKFISVSTEELASMRAASQKYLIP